MEGFQTIIIFSERKTKLVHYYFGLLLGLPALLVHNWVEMLSKVVFLFCWTEVFHEIFMEHKQSSSRGCSRICPLVCNDWQTRLAVRNLAQALILNKVVSICRSWEGFFYNYTGHQNVWYGWPVYDVKCLCSKGQKWGREGCQSHKLFNIWVLWHEKPLIWIVSLLTSKWQGLEIWNARFQLLYEIELMTFKFKVLPFWC